MNRRRFLATSAGLVATMAAPNLTLAASKPIAATPRMPEGFDRPDRHGEVWGGFSYQGRRVQCPIPRSIRRRNEDGSAPGPMDGLCVIASLVTDGRWVNFHREMARFWAAAKQEPGGYWPARAKAFARKHVPNMPFVSFEGNETTWMESVLARGIPIGVTYGFGRAYGRNIAHMVSLIGLWRDYAAIIDNNFPDWVAWVPRPEFDRRFQIGSYGWGFYWDIDPYILPSFGLGGALPYLAAATSAIAVGSATVAAAYLAVESRP